jgi:hypothetical protein
MIAEPMVRLAQTVHLSYTDTNTIAKRTKMRFDMTHFTEVFYQVCLKLFLSLSFVQRKTMHLSCIKIITISKQTKTSIHLSLVT